WCPPPARQQSPLHAVAPHRWFARWSLRPPEDAPHRAPAPHRRAGPRHGPRPPRAHALRSAAACRRPLPPARGQQTRTRKSAPARAPSRSSARPPKCASRAAPTQRPAMSGSGWELRRAKETAWAARHARNCSRWDFSAADRPCAYPAQPREVSQTLAYLREYTTVEPRPLPPLAELSILQAAFSTRMVPTFSSKDVCDADFEPEHPRGASQWP